METLGNTAFHAVAAMGAMLLIWLLMGKRQLAEFSPLDFAVSITAGTVAGAGIADPRIELNRTIAALVILGLLQLTVSWLGIKFRLVYKTVNHKPTVLVENGNIIKANLAKVRMPVVVLLQLLREKGVFDIMEVETAIFEPQGHLSVLKKAQYLPITPQQLALSVEPNRILIPVILEGELQISLLKKLGFSADEIDSFRNQHQNTIGDVFVAFMDNKHRLYVTTDNVQESGLFGR